MSPSSSLRLVVAAAGLVGLGGERPLAAGGAPVPSAEPAVVHELALVPGSGSLPTRYGLGVMSELPAPPELAPAPARRVTSGCPLEVRALVGAEPASESFAVVSVGAGSRIVRVGEGFRAGGGLVSVAAIEPAALVLRAGQRLVRCDFLR